MAKSYNLTLQLNLQGPANLKSVTSKIRKELSAASGSLTIKVDRKSLSSIDEATKKLRALTTVLQEARRHQEALNKGMDRLSRNFKSFSSSASKTQSSIVAMNANLSRTEKQAHKTGKSLSSLTSILAKGFRTSLPYAAVSKALNFITTAGTDAARSFVQFERNLNKVAQVTKTGTYNISLLSKEIRTASVAFGASSNDLSDLAVTFAQAGLAADQVRASIKAVAQASLSPTFTSMRDSAEGAIAAMSQFKIQAEQLGQVFDALNVVSGRFAVEFDDIVTAIRKGGGAFAAASAQTDKGTDSLNKFIGVFTAIRSTTRESADSIANGVKTITARIQQLGRQEKINDILGLEGDNRIEFTVDGEFIGAYEAIDEIQKKIKELNISSQDVRFSRIAEELGGIRQISRVIPLLTDFDKAAQAAGMAASASGQNARDAAKAQQTLAVQLRQTYEAFLDFSSAVANSGIKQFLSLVIQATTWGFKLAKAFGPQLGIFATLKTLQQIGKFTGLIQSKSAKGTPKGGFFRKIFGGQSQANTAAKEQAVAVSSNTVAIVKLTESVNALLARLPGSTSSSPTPKFASGGLVPGGRSNKDTVDAKLAPGEVVMSNAAGDAYGRDNLLRMNKRATGGKIENIKNLGKGLGNSDIDKRVENEKRLQYEDYVSSDIERTQLTADDILSKSPNKDFAGDLYDNYVSGQKGSYFARQGFAFEKWLQDKGFIPSGYQRADKQNYPVDFLKDGSPPIEVKFKNESEPDPYILSKQFRYLLDTDKWKTKEFTTDTDENVPLGKIKVIELAEGVKDAILNINPKESTLKKRKQRKNQRDERLSKAGFNLGGLIQKFAGGGGILSTDTVGAAIMEEVGNLGPAIIPGSEIISSTLKDRKLKEDELANMEKRLQAIFGNRSYNLVRQGLDGALGENVGGAINNRVVEMMNNLGLDLGFPGIAEGASGKFLTSLNDGVRSGIFEAVLNTIKNSGIYQVAQTASDRNDYFDFRDGLGEASRWFPSLEEIAFVDAKKSLESASPSAIARKIGNEGLREAGSMNLEELSRMAEEVQSSGDIKSSLRNAMAEAYGSAAFGRGTVIPLPGTDVVAGSPALSGKLAAIYKNLGLSDEEGNRIVKQIFGTATGAKWKGNAISLGQSKALALGGFIQKLADGGEAEAKKEKEFGQILLSQGSSGLEARYNPNDTRTGFVKAKKWKDNIWTIGLSQATKGFGPKLYDVVMEGVTELGGMLTSDRATVSGAARSVWDYYFKNRSDVSKTPLPRDAWTGNYAMIDEKLRGPEDTWPSTDDPAWALQTGYRKSPSLINDPKLVKRMKAGQSSAQMALSYFGSRFADGGSVPAMVSNGEAFVPPKLAAKIGSATLEKMNKADKNGMKFADGGGISLFKGPGSGTSDSIQTELPVGGFVLRERAVKAMKLKGGGATGLIPRYETGGEITKKIAQVTKSMQVLTQEKDKAEKSWQNLTTTLNDLDKQMAGEAKGSAQYQKLQAERQKVEQQAIAAETKYIAMRKGLAIAEQTRKDLIVRAKEIKEKRYEGKTEGEKESSFEKFNKKVNKYQSSMAYIKGEAEAEGLTIDKFERKVNASAQEAYVDKKDSIQESRKTLKSSLIESAAKGFADDKQKGEFASQATTNLKDILGGSATEEEINEAVTKLVEGIEKGMSVPEIMNSSEKFKEAMNKASDSARALAATNEKVASQYGLASEAMKVTEEQAKEGDWRQAGGADKLGGFGQLLDKIKASGLGDTSLGKKFGLDKGAFGFSQTGVGKKLTSLQNRFSGDKMLNSLSKSAGKLSPKLGSLVKSMGGLSKVVGGLPGIISSAVSAFADIALPGILDSIGLGDTATGAGIQGAVSGAASGAATGAMIGSFVPIIGPIVGAVVGGIIGGIRGAFKGFRTKQLELTMRNLNTTMGKLDDSLGDYENNKTAENKQKVRDLAKSAQTSVNSLGDQANMDGWQPRWFNLWMGSADDIADNALGAYIDGIKNLNEQFHKIAMMESASATLEDVAASRDAVERGDMSSSTLLKVRMAATGQSAEQIMDQYGEAEYAKRTGYTGHQLRVGLRRARASGELDTMGQEAFAAEAKKFENQLYNAKLQEQANRELESVVNQLRKASAAATRISTELAAADADLEKRLGGMRGSGEVYGSRNKTLEVLKNPRGYSDTEFNQATDVISNYAGGGEAGQAIQDKLKAKRVIDEQLPNVLKNVTSLDQADDAISNMIDNAGLSETLGTELKQELMKAITDKIGEDGEGAIAFGELADDVPALSSAIKILEENEQLAANMAEQFGKALERSTAIANQYSKALEDARKRTIEGAKNQANNNRQIKEAFGQRLTMQDRTGAFFAEYNNLSGQDANSIEDINIQAINDERKLLADQRKGIQNNRDKAAESNPEMVGKFDEALARNAEKDKALVGALELVANSADLLTAELDAYRAKTEVQNRQVDLGTRLATSDPQELVQIAKEMQAVNVALGSDERTKSAYFSNVDNRKNAMQGLQYLDQLGFDDQTSGMLKAQTQLNVLENTPGMSKILDQMTGSGQTLREILKERSDPEKIKENMKKADAASKLQEEANKSLVDMDKKIAAALREELLGADNPVAEAVRNAQTAIVEAINNQSTDGSNVSGSGSGSTGTGGGSGSTGTGGGSGRTGTGGGSGRTGTGGGAGPNRYAGLTREQIDEQKAKSDAEIKEKEEALEQARKNKQESLNRGGSAFETRAAQGAQGSSTTYTVRVGDSLPESEAKREKAQKELDEAKARRAELDAASREEAGRFYGSVGSQTTIDNFQSPLTVEEKKAAADYRLRTGGGTGPELPPSMPTPPQGSSRVTVSSLPSLSSTESLTSTGGIQGGFTDIADKFSALSEKITVLDSSLTTLASVGNSLSTAFGTITTYLQNYSVPLKLDEASTQKLATFNSEFGRYVEMLSTIKLPDQITMTGNHTLNVKIDGTKAFEEMSESFHAMIVTQIDLTLKDKFPDIYHNR